MSWVFVLLAIFAGNQRHAVDHEITTFVFEGWPVQINTTTIRQTFDIVAVSLISVSTATFLFSPLDQNCLTKFLA